jgi:hypothetical protein
MPYHFGNNEYEHLIGGTVGNVVIKNIEFRPDKIYMGTDGYAGNPYVLTLYLKKPEMRVFPSKVGTFHNGKTFPFMQFQEIVNKYGDFIPNPNPKQ